MKAVGEMNDLEFGDLLKEVIDRLENEGSFGTRIRRGNSLNALIVVESDYDEISFTATKHGLFAEALTALNKDYKL